MRERRVVMGLEEGCDEWIGPRGDENAEVDAIVVWVGGIEGGSRRGRKCLRVMWDGRKRETRTQRYL